MVTLFGEKTLHTLLSTGDQVTIASDIEDAYYMIRKLQEKYAKWNHIIINVHKTEL